MDWKMLSLLKVAWMEAPEELQLEWESPTLEMHYEAMKPMLDNATSEELMQFIEDIISYKLSPNGEDD